MTAPLSQKSYQDVFYDLRPAKQIERRMIIDVLQRLQAAGFAVRNYQYTGMGSIYYVDFILFHKILGMHNMLNVEYDLSIRNRVGFNRPFDCVRVAMEPIGDAISRLDKDISHLLWIDYDYRITSSVMSDVALAASRLPSGSVVLITVDAEPPMGEGPGDWKRYYEDQAGSYFEYGWDTTQFGRSNLPLVAGTLLRNAIQRGVSGRPSVEFVQLFFFEYADGHRMTTLGGMIANEADANRLRSAELASLPFLRQDKKDRPFEIRVPRLTRKERLHLDCHMPRKAEWLPTEFELLEDAVADYASVYRYYPSYAELVL